MFLGVFNSNTYFSLLLHVWVLEFLEEYQIYLIFGASVDSSI